jgi:PsbP.
MKIIIGLVFTALAFYGHSQNKMTNDFTKFSKDNYSIQYPKSWRLDTSKLYGTSFILFSPLENDSDKFSENITLMIQSLAGQNIGLEEYKQISEVQTKNLLKDGTIAESSIIKTGDNSYFKMVYTMTRGKQKLKDIGICYIKNDEAYLLTFSCESDKFEVYKNVADNIFKSFSLTN